MKQAEFAKTRKKFSKNISANLFNKVKNAFAVPSFATAVA
jgi:hypothetical protein